MIFASRILSVISTDSILLREPGAGGGCGERADGGGRRDAGRRAFPATRRDATFARTSARPPAYARTPRSGGSACPPSAPRTCSPASGSSGPPRARPSGPRRWSCRGPRPRDRETTKSESLHDTRTTEPAPPPPDRARRNTEERDATDTASVSASARARVLPVQPATLVEGCWRASVRVSARLFHWRGANLLDNSRGAE